MKCRHMLRSLVNHKGSTEILNEVAKDADIDGQILLNDMAKHIWHVSFVNLANSF